MEVWGELPKMVAKVAARKKTSKKFRMKMKEWERETASAKYGDSGSCRENDLKN